MMKSHRQTYHWMVSTDGILFYMFFFVTGGRMRYRGSSSNNPNLMYQDTCHLRTNSAGEGGSGKDSRGGIGHNSHTSHDGHRPSSSHRDGGRDRRSSYGSSSDQYQSYSASRGYKSRDGGQLGGSGGMDKSNQLQGQFCQPPPAPPSLPLGGPRPLMAQQFAPPQPPLMGLIGQPPYSFTSFPTGPSSHK